MQRTLFQWGRKRPQTPGSCGALFAIALCAVMAAGCGGQGHYLQKGIDQYNRAEYPGAEGDFSRVNSATLKERALSNYLVYRGLTEYHLGQRDAAQSYLRKGKEVYSRGSANWLPAPISAEMDAALADLGGGSAAPTAPPETVAPVTPPPPTTGEALVPVKTASPVKTATASAPPAPVKTATASTSSPAPVKTSAPPTKTLSSSQSTSPK